MSKTVSSAPELGQAILHKEDVIIVEGDISRGVFSIVSIGPVVWTVGLSLLSVAVASSIALASGVGAPAGTAGMVACTPGLIATFGSVGTAVAAIEIAVAGGGVAALTSLRKYKAEQCADGSVMLTKR